MKNIFAKASVDSLDFIEYFCVPSENKNQIIDTFVGYQWTIESLLHQSLSGDYSRYISSLIKDYIRHPVVYPSVDPNDVEKFIKDHRNNISQYALERGLTKDICQKHELFHFNPVENENYDYGTLASYFLFNKTIRDEYNLLLKHYDKDFTTLNHDYLVTVSRDAAGNVNNLIFRTTDKYIEKNLFKYLFSYGNCATVGLDKVDTSKKTILVEGSMDAIAGIELGYNVVGLGSTIVTPFHRKYLHSVHAPIFILLDSDEVGKKRTSESGFQCLKLPDKYKDPFEYYTNGIDIFAEVIQQQVYKDS